MIFHQVYDWSTREWPWYVGAVVKLIAWMCAILLGSVCVSLITTHGQIHGHSKNIDCILQCIKSPLNQSIPDILNQQEKCSTEKESLQTSINNCTKELKDSKSNYTTQTKLLNNKVKEVANLTDESEACKAKSANISIVLADAVNKSQKLAIYVHHLELLGLIDNYVRGLETCRMWLQEYCTLKKNEKSLKDKEVETMNRFADWLGCKEPLPEAGHYETILPTFTERIYSIYDNRKKLENLLIVGDFEKMKIAQQKAKNLPSEDCQFLCTKSEESKEADPGSIFEAKTLIAVLSRFWWKLTDQEDSHV